MKTPPAALQAASVKPAKNDAALGSATHITIGASQTTAAQATMTTGHANQSIGATMPHPATSRTAVA